MTPTERLILENQIAIMLFIRHPESKACENSLQNAIKETRTHLNESDRSGEH